MDATVLHSRNPFQPWKDRELYKLIEEKSISDWLTDGNVEFSGPTVCIYNGDAVLRKDWSEIVIEDGDVVVFMALPEGGGGSNPLALVAMVALMVVAAPLAVALASGQLGGSLLVFNIIKAGIIIGGGMLINALLPPPKPPSPQRLAEGAAPSPTYSLQAQGNAARLGSSIPVIYGEHRTFPDFGAAPYAEFEGGDQYLYQLFVIGQGHYDILDMKIEDTDISSFEEITTEIVNPGEKVTLFPADVETSGEVSGQTLETNIAIGGFTVNASGTEINKVGLDFIAPRGLFDTANDGSFNSMSVNFVIEIAPVDASDVVGSYTPLANETITGSTSTPIRKSFSYSVSPGRYSVRVKRLDTKDTSNRAAHELTWAGLRGYFPGDQQYGDLTLVAMKLRATNNLSNQSARKINMKVQRKLHTWDSVNGWSANPVATRSIVWAIADVCRAEYGASMPDERYDLTQLEYLQTVFDQRATTFGAAVADYFDGVFDSRMNFWEALEIICRVGRVMPIRQAGVIRFIRDQEQNIPTAMFSMRNIIKGSFKVEYIMPGEETADAVEVEYVDRESLMPKTVLSKLSGSSGLNVAKLKLFGATTPEHANREGLYIAASNQYRRKLIQFETELEGHIPMIGDLVGISHDVPKWGVSGEVVSVTGDELTLSEPVTFDAGNHYIALRKPNGEIDGPHLCTEDVNDPYKVNLDPNVTLGFTPYTGLEQERTHFAFGTSDTIYELARVIPPIMPRGKTVELNCVNENSIVHSVDSGTTPVPTPALPLPGTITMPVVSQLSVTQGGTVASPMLFLSWAPAPDADHYNIEVSYDNANWTRYADTFSTSYALSVEPGNVWVRVAAVGRAQGPWIVWSGTTGAIPPPADVINLVSEVAFSGNNARISWDAAKRAESYRVQVESGGLVKRDVIIQGTRFEYTSQMSLDDGGPWRTLTFKVKAVGNGESANWATLTIGNSAPSPLTGVTLYDDGGNILVDYDIGGDTDWVGAVVHMDTVSGFTPDASNRVYKGTEPVALIRTDKDGVEIAAGTQYFIRVAGFDAHGYDPSELDFGLSEYAITPTESNSQQASDILQKLRLSLTDPNQEPTDGSFVFDAGRFLLTTPSGDRVIFAATQDDQGVWWAGIESNVIINGSLTVSNLTSGELPTDTQIDVANGSIVIDGTGIISVYDGPDVGSPRDLAQLTDSRLDFWYWDGVEYKIYKTVRRVERGVAQSGATVTLPGVWRSQPEVQVSPSALEVYVEAYSAQDQKHVLRAENLTETPVGSGIYEFDAVAELQLSANAGTVVTNNSSGTQSSDTWLSPEEDVPNGVDTVTVNASASQKVAVGIPSNEYYYRTIDWRVEARDSGTLNWNTVFDSYKSIVVGATFNAISDNKTVTLPANTDRIRVRYSAYNTDGSSFVVGSKQYTNATDVITHPNLSARRELVGTTTDTANSWGYTPPAGVYRVEYSYTYNWDEYEVTWGGFQSVTWEYTAHLITSNLSLQKSDAQCSSNCGSGASIWVRDGGWDATAFYLRAEITNSGNGDETGNGWVDVSVTSLSATVYYETEDTNAIDDQVFNFDSFDWVASGAVALASGTLNYVAVGN